MAADGGRFLFTGLPRIATLARNESKRSAGCGKGVSPQATHTNTPFGAHLLSIIYYLLSIIYALKKRGKRPVFYMLSS